MTRKTLESMSVTTADATSAFVPCTSKWSAHSGSHHGFDDCCLLKTSRVCAAVAMIQRLITTTRPVITVWARCSGAGLTFILAVVRVFSSLFSSRNVEDGNIKIVNDRYRRRLQDKRWTLKNRRAHNQEYPKPMEKEGIKQRSEDGLSSGRNSLPGNISTVGSSRL
jgi:hypothetical protein